MSGKLPQLIGYICFIIFLAVTPWSVMVSGTDRKLDRKPVLIGLALMATAAIFLAVIHRHMPQFLLLIASCTLCSVLVIAPEKRSIAMALAAAISCCLSTLLLWWVTPEAITWPKIAMAIGIWYLLTSCLAIPWVEKKHHRADSLLTAVLTLLCFAIIYVGAFETRTQWNNAWHHWGAYWAPVEAIKAGLIPFADIPLQYGAGPTFFLSLLPVKQGFDGMHDIVLLFTLFGLWAVIDICIFSVRSLKSYFISIVAGVAGAVASLLWIAFPPAVSSSMVYPSTFGMRFAPAFVLLWSLARFPSRKKQNFVLWAMCTMWSIESAFFANVIYWPSHLQLEKATSFKLISLQVARIARNAILSLVSLVCVWALAFWLIFGVAPSLRLYVIYALFPPGPMPINWSGPIWCLLFLLGLAVIALHARETPGEQKRVIHLTSLCLLACASYYLGRSHDNNVLNLMPAAVMVLCAVTGSTREETVFATAARSMIIATLALLPFFGFADWSNMAAAKKGDWSKSMSFFRASDPNLILAIDYVRTQRNENFEVITNPMNIQPYGPTGVWTSVHPLCNFYFFPAKERRHFIEVGMMKLNMAGWLIIETTNPDVGYIEDFKAVYRLSEQRVFGQFTAYRFEPRPLASLQTR